MRKSWTYFFKLLQRIFNHFSNIKFKEFCKKDDLPVVVIFILDLIKTSVQGTPKNKFLLLNIFAKSSIVNIRLGSEYASKLSIKQFFPIIIIDPQMLWIKKQMVSLLTKFFVHIKIITVCKKEVAKNSKKIIQITTIIQINTFITKDSINGFISWLLAISLVSWQMCSISSNPPRETPASTSKSPVLSRYFPFFANFLKSFQHFFWRSCYYYQISHWNIQRSNHIPIAFCFSTNGSSQSCSSCNISEKSLLS